jgi:esterase/lipase superfamily enzyme
MPNLSDERQLNNIRASHHIHIATGSGDYEDPEASRRFAGILSSKGINYDLDIWGHDIKHDWSTWRKMLPHILHSKF